MEAARDALNCGQYDIVVLDEINVAIKLGLLSATEVAEAVSDRKNGVEVVLTGRYAPPELLELADYITEMRSMRHPYQKGVLSRKGVDR